MSDVLADTNVLVRWALAHDPLGEVARRAVERLLRTGATVYVCPQNLTEFWSVATRPTSANGFGLTPARTAEEIDRIEGMFPLLEETPEIYSQWRQLVRTAGVSGRQAFDARIAAVMMVHHVNGILTFNIDDFRRYPDITMVDPHGVPEAAPAPDQVPE